MMMKAKLVNILLDIQNSNWIVSGHRPNGMTKAERAYLFRSKMDLTIPMLEDMIDNITVR
jgi:hypothetical protein